MNNNINELPAIVRRPRVISAEELLTFKVPTILLIREFRLGDIIAFEPVIRWVRQNYPDHRLAYAVGDKYMEALTADPHLDCIIPFGKYSALFKITRYLPTEVKILLLDFVRPQWRMIGNFLTKFNPKVTTENYFFWDGLLGMVSQLTGLPKLSGQPHFYLEPDVAIPFKLPMNYVTFHTASQDASKDWQPEKWRKLAEYFIYKNIAVVELGWDSQVNLPDPLYFNGTHLSLHQSAKIIRGAKCFFGVDSGLAHLANALKVDGVCLLGALDRRTVYVRHIPYTGLYSCNHIVRAKSRQPAAALSVQEVISFYENKSRFINRLKAKLEFYYTSIIYNRFWRNFYFIKDNMKRHVAVKYKPKTQKGERFKMRPFSFFKKMARMRRQTEEILFMVKDMNKTAGKVNALCDAMTREKEKGDIRKFYKYISYAQNGEDILLYKLLSHVSRGFYVDIGCWDWRRHNVGLFFYNRGWQGINIDAHAERLEGYREHRERDLNMAACLSDVDNREVTLYLLGELNTINTENVERLKQNLQLKFKERQVKTTRFDTLIASQTDFSMPSEVHWLKVDTEAHEKEVLAGMDLSIFRPWVIMVESTLPNSSIPTHETFEPMLLEQGYKFFTMSAVNRVYLAEERAEELETSFKRRPLLPFLRHEEYSLFKANGE